MKAIVYTVLFAVFFSGAALAADDAPPPAGWKQVYSDSFDRRPGVGVWLSRARGAAV